MSSVATADRLGSRATNPSAWPAEFAPVIDRLLAERLGHFGATSVRLRPVRTIDRPYSTLLEIAVDGSACPGAFIKVPKPRADGASDVEEIRKNVIHEFEATRRVHEALAARAGFAAVKPLACYPSHLAIVTERAAGPSLSDVLRRHVTWWGQEHSPSPARLAGAWLRAAQETVPHQATAIEPAAIRKYLDRRLAELEKAKPLRLTSAGRQTLERYRDALLERIPAEALRATWIHADYCPENIIVGSGGVTVLDYTMSKSGTTYHDIAHVFLGIDAMRLKPWARAGAITRVQRELLDGFEPGLDTSTPLFGLMLFQHVLCHVVALQGSGLATTFMRRRHLRWLERTAGLGAGSWAR